MAISFRPLKKGCPVCAGARQDCRESIITHLIHCRHDVETAVGFRFVGIDAIGFSMWAIDDGHNRGEKFRSAARRQQEAATRERRLRDEAEKRTRLLDADERDRNIRKLHAQLGLTARHRQNLRDRRLTDRDIDDGMFFSIDPWQEVMGLNPELAGVDLYGRKLLNSHSGFACPITDVRGRLIGWQTRLDDAIDNKYKWPTSKTRHRPHGPTAHLPNGELPITCCRPAGGVRDTSIGLSEGFLKTYIAARLREQVFLGASGGNFASSPEQFQAYLDELSLELGTKTVTLFPDAGSIANNAVMRHYERTIQMATEFGYSVRVAWWGQVEKSHPDVDELSDGQEVSYIPPDDFLHMGVGRSRRAHRFSDFLGWLPRLLERVSKSNKTRWGFGRKGDVEVEPVTPSTEITKYEQGERQDVWVAANHAGYRHLLDLSATGHGKSFDAGRLIPELFPDARQIIYVSAEHRNPTTPTLMPWSDLEARHQGLYRDSFGKLRRADKGEPYVVPPNCGRNETIAALRSKNIPGADTADLICKTCPNFELCCQGVVYGFLPDRAQALQKPQLRAHPDSLPSPDDYDYRHVVLVWEEAGEILKAHRKVYVTASDVSRTIADLAGKLPEVFQLVRTALLTLHLYLTGGVKQPNKYGWDDTQVREAIGHFGDLDVHHIREGLRQTPGYILNGDPDERVPLSDLPRWLRKKFCDSDSESALKIAREMALNWLPDFLDVVVGNSIGSLRIEQGVLTLSLSDSRKRAIANAAGFNIYLDATTTADEIVRTLDLSDERYLFSAQEVTKILDNLEIIQVTGLGRLGLAQRSQFSQARVNALVSEIEKKETDRVVALDFKRHTIKGDGKRHWWVDDRGINDLESCKTLVLIGTPCPNLADLKAEFTILYGRHPGVGTERVRYPIQVVGELPRELEPYFEMDLSSDQEFREFCRRRILASFRQAIGRLRANRRPEEELKVYIIADYPLDLPVKLMKASEITPDAASKTERLLMAGLRAMKQIVADGQKLTQKAVAQATRLLDPLGKGYSQQHLSRYWALLKTLLYASTSEMSETDPPLPDPDETQWMSDKYLPLLAEGAPVDLLQGIMLVFEAYGTKVFKAIWEGAPASAQIQILSVLILTLPHEELLTLTAVIGDGII